MLFDPEKLYLRPPQHRRSPPPPSLNLNLSLSQSQCRRVLDVFLQFDLHDKTASATGIRPPSPAAATRQIYR
ncbi:hypothetical protein ACFX2A_003410 [Malus domestica]